MAFSLSPLPALLMAGLAFSACKKDGSSMTVVKDCTGTYLRFDSMDYQVCNTEKTESFADGAAVEAAFEKINACASDTGIRCMMFHKDEGWVKVTQIKAR